jgi:hypothetical protein
MLIDQVMYYLPLVLILAAFAAMIWADSNNPLEVFTKLPSLFVPALEVPQLR